MTKIPRPLAFLFITYIAGILFFFAFRISLIITNAAALKEIPVQDILLAVFMGFRFDTVISGYILAVPAVLFLLSEVIPAARSVVYRISFIWIYLLYLVSFFVCAADLPYFLQYNSRITVSILN